jgi:predicted lipoprotein with Yx(FWY)xxD motif
MGNQQSFLAASSVLQVTQSPTYGAYLTDPSGRALYIYTQDPANTSTCSGDCLVKWPIYAPVNQQSTSGMSNSNMISNRQPTGNTPAANMLDNQPSSIQPNLIGRVVANNQLTYNNWPLYYYYLDMASGDTKGQTVDANWYLIRPDGRPIVTQPTTPTQTPAAVNDMSNNWKQAITYQSYVDYYRWKKWSKYADSHHEDRDDRKAYRRWYDDHWHANHDKIHRAYDDWCSDYNPHHRYDWDGWQAWYRAD